MSRLRALASRGDPEVNSDGQFPPASVQAAADRHRRRLTAAFAVLLVIGLVVNAATLVLFSRSLAGIRGDFCSYSAGVYKVTLELPQVPARVEAERNDLELMRQLGCGKG